MAKKSWYDGLQFSMKRIAASGDEYGGEVLVATSTGSRQLDAK